MNQSGFVRPATMRSLLIGLSGSLRRQVGAIATNCGCYRNALPVEQGFQFQLCGLRVIVSGALLLFQQWLRIRNRLLDLEVLDSPRLTCSQGEGSGFSGMADRSYHFVI